MTHDVYIAHSEREAHIATKLRTDLPRIGISVHPAMAFHERIMSEVAVIVTLQATYKPADVVRAAVAAAQHPDIDRPLVAAYVQDDTLALQRIGREAVYVPYERGVVLLAFAVWRAMHNPLADTLTEPPDNEPHPVNWLIHQKQRQHL